MSNAAMRQVEMPAPEPAQPVYKPPQLVAPPPEPVVREVAKVPPPPPEPVIAQPVAAQVTPPPAPPPTLPTERPPARAFRKPTIKQKERDDIPRQTYYVKPENIANVKYYALLDARKISDVVNEAIEMWVEQRDMLQAQLESERP